MGVLPSLLVNQGVTNGYIAFTKTVLPTSFQWKITYAAPIKKTKRTFVAEENEELYDAFIRWANEQSISFFGYTQVKEFTKNVENIERVAPFKVDSLSKWTMFVEFDAEALKAVAQFNDGSTAFKTVSSTMYAHTMDEMPCVLEKKLLKDLWRADPPMLPPAMFFTRVEKFIEEHELLTGYELLCTIHEDKLKWQGSLLIDDPEGYTHANVKYGLIPTELVFESLVEVGFESKNENEKTPLSTYLNKLFGAPKENDLLRFERVDDGWYEAVVGINGKLREGYGHSIYWALKMATGRLFNQEDEKMEKSDGPNSTYKEKRWTIPY